MDSGGIKLEPISPNSGASSSRITGRRQTGVAAQNIGTQTQGINALEITPENTEAIRTALKNAPMDILQKALRDADVQITQYTLDIVKSLINGSLPLTEENIVDLLLQSHVFKDAQTDVLALMMRLEIPATPENVEQFENLISKGEKLSENLQNLINKLPTEIFKGAQNLSELSFVLNEIVKMIEEQPEMPQVQRQRNQEGNQQRQSAQNNQENGQQRQPAQNNWESGQQRQPAQNNQESNQQRQPVQNNQESGQQIQPAQNNQESGQQRQPVQNNQESNQQRQPVQNNQESGQQRQSVQNNNQGARLVLTRYELNTLLNMLRSLGAPNQVLNKVININSQSVEIARAQTEPMRNQPETERSQIEPSRAQIEPMRIQPETERSQIEPARTQSEPMRTQSETEHSQTEPARIQPEPMHTQPEPEHSTEPARVQPELERSQTEPNINNLNHANQNNQTGQNANNLNQVNQTNQNMHTTQIRPNNSENILEVINKFVQDIAAKISQRPQDSEGSRSFFSNIKNMLESPVVQKLIKVEIQEKWVLTPQELMKGSPELSKYYNALNQNLHKFEQLLRIFNPSISNNPDNNPNNMNNNVYMQAKNVRDNLTLMSEVSKTMPFLQIPLKFSNEKIINSDLYVFNNKKRKSASPVKSVNALIKLELENLGGVDVYINIAGKNARARFFSNKIEAVEEMSKNLPELDEAIHNLGFNFTSAAAAADEEREFDILDDFINREVPKTEIRKYILRKKI